MDASAYTGVRLTVRGNGERYNLHLKTGDTARPWQSYRSTFETGPQWQSILLPFDSFEPYRIDTRSIGAACGVSGSSQSVETSRPICV